MLRSEDPDKQLIYMYQHNEESSLAVIMCFLDMKHQLYTGKRKIIKHPGKSTCTLFSSALDEKINTTLMC